MRRPPTGGIADPEQELTVESGGSPSTASRPAPLTGGPRHVGPETDAGEVYSRMADYSLPDLPYDYAALEPHISGRIMELHHDKHHAAYVTGANTALEKLAAARAADDFAAVNRTRRTSRSTSAGTSTTRSSGRTSPPTAATSRPASWVRRSTSSSARSRRSRSTSPPTRSASRAPAGRSSRGTPSARGSSSCSCTTSRATSRSASSRSCVLDMWEHAFYLRLPST